MSFRYISAVKPNFDCGLPEKQVLPKDGYAFYLKDVFDVAASFDMFEYLIHHIPWKQDEVILYGKKILTRREFSWYGDEPYNYGYSKIQRSALPWTPELTDIKVKVEEICGETFNCCLLNFYHTGNEGMGWHSDDEKVMQAGGLIASLSLGAARKFRFKHKSQPLQTEILLENGSLLLMGGETQKYWQHQLPVSKKVKEPRINLTFRNFVK